MEAKDFMLRVDEDFRFNGKVCIPSYKDLKRLVLAKGARVHLVCRPT